MDFSDPGATLVFGLPEVWTIRMWPETRYAWLLSGFSMSGGLAGLVLPLSKCLVHRDSESDRVVPKIRGFTSTDCESL